MDTGTDAKRQGGAVRIAIVSQGEEILGGKTVDTNAAWLAEQSIDAGHPTRRMVTAGDQVQDILWALQEAAKVSDVILCTGGLGPTSDDLTAEAVAQWAQVPIERRADALAQIEARYAQWGRTMIPNNAKQADLPQGSRILPNALGTAPGFAIDVAGKTLYCMPGVPREMRPMFLNHVLPSMAQGHPPIIHRIRTIGVPESHLQQTLGPMDLGPCTLGFRSHSPEVIVKLVYEPDTPEAIRSRHVAQAVAAIGRGVYTVDGGDLAEVLSERLVARGETLALAESCTSGQVSAWVGSVPGASRYLIEGAVVYANEAKMRSCGVSAEDLTAHGAVSEPVARQLAQGIRQRAQTTWGVGITGIAGPGGGSEDKPVGTVHIAIAGPDVDVHQRYRIPGNRAQITLRAAGMALGLLLEQL